MADHTYKFYSIPKLLEKAASLGLTIAEDTPKDEIIKAILEAEATQAEQSGGSADSPSPDGGTSEPPKDPTEAEEGADAEGAAKDPDPAVVPPTEPATGDPGDEHEETAEEVAEAGEGSVEAEAPPQWPIHSETPRFDIYTYENGTSIALSKDGWVDVAVHADRSATITILANVNRYNRPKGYADSHDRTINFANLDTFLEDLNEALDGIDEAMGVS